MESIKERSRGWVEPILIVAWVRPPKTLRNIDAWQRGNDNLSGLDQKQEFESTDCLPLENNCDRFRDDVTLMG
jgi:hypothetical protein